ncbi:hypothetical protein TSUD_285830 [Trifolium subterraneum]|uniref:F-box domain-containing protein n=1 Tax=Trifolium subterraneum TaxID=3900 RepID=A0A2Z6NR05_TRISU|nr:hypothetical protein TSUD_285830 [Trifolium subterraneum]
MKTKRTSPLMSSSQQMVSSYLPDECWEYIFKFIIMDDNNNDGNNNTCYLNSLSLVSKRFLSITNRLLFSLTVNKELTYFHIFERSLNTSHLFLIAECFPLLEQLDLSYPSGCKNHSSYVDGIEALSLALTKLRKVKLSGFPINNQSLFHLFNNCRYLEEVILSWCDEITSVGLASALRERPTLTSLSLSISGFNPEYRQVFTTSHFIDSLMSLTGLSCLVLHNLKISDELLFAIAREVSTYPTFGSRIYDFLKDQHVVELSSFLVDLVSINLSCCRELTKSALFTLAKNCPSLSEIKMEKIGGKVVGNSDSLVDFGVYPQLKSLYLGKNSWLSDKIITKFASIFPNLPLLDLNNCKRISEGICQVLRKCGRIKHLNLAYCSRVKLLGMNFAVPNLEVLNLSHTTVDDETLYLISKNCCGLLQLSLKFAKGITKKGLKHVVENCTQLIVHGYVTDEYFDRAMLKA